MNRLRSLISQSPAIVIATAALALSMAGGATAATVMANRPARVVWHNLTLINHWKYGGFDSFHASYYVDANRVIHLRGSVRLGTAGKPAFQLPKGLRPSHILSIPIYTSNGPEEMTTHQRRCASRSTTPAATRLSGTSPASTESRSPRGDMRARIRDRVIETEHEHPFECRVRLSQGAAS